MQARLSFWVLLFSAFLLLASPAFSAGGGAPSGDGVSRRCEAAIDKAAGRYSQCLLEASAKFAKKGNEDRLLDQQMRCGDKYNAQIADLTGCSDSNNDNGFDIDGADSNTDPIVPPANPIQPANVSQPEWLYVQTAATAQMTSDTTLEIPFTREVFGFTDRPNRRYAYFTASEFEAFWSEEGANSFSEDPPNAVLTWLDGEEQREAEVIINNATVYSDGTQESLVYEVTLETEQMPDAQMAFVSLFVDSKTDCSPANWKPKAHLAGCKLRDAELSGANLSGANLKGADLYNTLLIGANLSGADLSGADLRGVDLTLANLTGANLFSADVREMFLDDATLTVANLRNAQLVYSSLTNADLTGADLSGADLSYADLSGADLSGANLTSVNLLGANLLGVTLNDTDLTDARFAATTCPDGTVTDLWDLSARCSL